MRINLNYNEFNLGHLMQVENGYLWTPNIKEIARADEKYELAMDMFFLPNEQVVYPFVPRHFNEFLDASERADLKEKAGIEDDDSEFVRLYKMGKLDYFSQEFVIKS